MYSLTRETWQKIDWGAGCASVAILIYSFYLAWAGFYCKLPDAGQEWSNTKIQQAIFLVFWICGPPIWFWLEYYFLFKRLSNPVPDEFEKMKYGQDVSSKIWLAVVTALLMLYFGKDLRH